MASAWVCSQALGLKLKPLHGCSVAGDILKHWDGDVASSLLSDFYVVCNGRVLEQDQSLDHGLVYRLEPRLRGGKGGFGSMLRALGAQIEKTTNREACRDLSGRRLRDVNHEKEMAEWLKKQSEREAEKEQRRLEKIQNKLKEPKHQFSDAKFTQQCHELSERLEDSVIKGLQASCSSGVRGQTSKRHRDQSQEEPEKKKSAPYGWTGLDLSDEDSDPDQSSDSDEDRPTASGSGPVLEARPKASPGPVPEASPGPVPEASPGPVPEASPGPVPEASPGPVPEARPEASPGPVPEASPGPVPEARLEASPGPVPEARPEASSVPESRPDMIQKKGESSTDLKENQEKEQNQTQTPEQRPLLDLDSVSCAEDLEVLGLKVLKEELQRRGLKCGGTLSQRAARLFSVKTQT
ncbi:unnamed protein product [Knipowitschia caucasica]|uniref:Replication stress response regulator SDE2 n=1 Tax=Knipowitschia caucasica TaxID=637954 RepID=A0AAV2M251_KNICA